MFVSALILDNDSSMVDAHMSRVYSFSHTEFSKVSEEAFIVCISQGDITNPFSYCYNSTDKHCICKMKLYKTIG